MKFDSIKKRDLLYSKNIKESEVIKLCDNYLSQNRLSDALDCLTIVFDEERLKKILSFAVSEGNAHLYFRAHKIAGSDESVISSRLDELIRICEKNEFIAYQILIYSFLENEEKVSQLKTELFPLDEDEGPTAEDQQ